MRGTISQFPYLPVWCAQGKFNFTLLYCTCITFLSTIAANNLAQVVTFLSLIWEVPGSNLDRHTDCP